METTLRILDQSLLPFYSLFSIFVILSYQEINNKIRSSYDSFREWIKFRLSFNQQVQTLLLALGVDKEPDSWLEKDVIFHMFHFYRKVNELNIVDYKIASIDYYFYAKDHLKFKKYVLRLLLLLTILMIIVVATRPFLIKSYHSVGVLPLILFYMVTFGLIFEVCKGPKPRIDNNTVTNRRNDTCLRGTENEINELEKLVYSI